MNVTYSITHSLVVKSIRRLQNAVKNPPPIADYLTLNGVIKTTKEKETVTLTRNDDVFYWRTSVTR